MWSRWSMITTPSQELVGEHKTGCPSSCLISRSNPVSDCYLATCDAVTAPRSGKLSLASWGADSTGAWQAIGIAVLETILVHKRYVIFLQPQTASSKSPRRVLHFHKPTQWVMMADCCEWSTVLVWSSPYYPETFFFRQFLHPRKIAASVCNPLHFTTERGQHQVSNCLCLCFIIVELKGCLVLSPPS